MNIWCINDWTKYYGLSIYRKGLRVRYDPFLDQEVERAIKEFIAWLRTEYVFPKRVRVYIKSVRRIRSKAGDLVCGTFFRPADRNAEPYICIATGDYLELVKKHGKDNALAKIIWSIAHELTHYFQWLNDLNLTLIGEERQATNYASNILYDYSQTRDHP